MNHARLVLTVLLCGLTGCMSPGTSRLQSEDTEATAPGETRLVGDITSFANAGPIQVSGVGLVINLDGTGGSTPPGTYRNMLEQELKKRGIDNFRELIDSKNNALVLVSGEIPAGARKGDRIDLDVTLPTGSKATSLRGGYLAETVLVDFNTSENLAPQSAAVRGNKLLLGDELVVAEGPLMPGIRKEKADDQETLVGVDASQPIKKAQLWSGGRIKSDRLMYVALNTGHQRYAESVRVGNRLNDTFSGTLAGVDKMAEPKTKEVVTLKVPQHYRQNLARYMRVVRMVPLSPVPDGADYRRNLQMQLQDPATCMVAALKLEALGASSVPLLEAALRNESPLVRFAAAEALTYLGRTSGVDELGAIAMTEPTLQAYCLTALSSLDEAKCHAKLQELLTCEVSEVRYGAFRALQTLDSNNEMARGEKLNETYFLHELAPDSKGMVHVLTSHRPEVVVFGRTPKLVAPFSYAIGNDFTLTAGLNDSKITISRFSVNKGQKQVQCGYEVGEVIRTLASLEASYSDILDLLSQANRCKSLNCPLAVDALPKAASVKAIAERGKVSGLPNPDAPEDGTDTQANQ
ncbi:flagellar basal body P-ring protein FlgI [Tuwongella immobilis]|nr:flagellar basal body P-ring protein FlgI [Tuwongella immobilis]